MSIIKRKLPEPSCISLSSCHPSTPLITATRHPMKSDKLSNLAVFQVSGFLGGRTWGDQSHFVYAVQEEHVPA
eukprot:2882752-Prymnesium_polylepis.1